MRRRTSGPRSSSKNGISLPSGALGFLLLSLFLASTHFWPNLGFGGFRSRCAELAFRSATLLADRCAYAEDFWPAFVSGVFAFYQVWFFDDFRHTKLTRKTFSGRKPSSKNETRYLCFPGKVHIASSMARRFFLVDSNCVMSRVELRSSQNWICVRFVGRR